MRFGLYSCQLSVLHTSGMLLLIGVEQVTISGSNNFTCQPINAHMYQQDTRIAVALHLVATTLLNC